MIKMGSIADNDLGGLYAQIKCNCDATDYLCRELERQIAEQNDHFANADKKGKK